MRIVVQYALRRATNLSEVLLCHQKKKKNLFFGFFTHRNIDFHYIVSSTERNEKNEI